MPDLTALIRAVCGKIISLLKKLVGSTAELVPVTERLSRAGGRSTFKPDWDVGTVLEDRSIPNNPAGKSRKLKSGDDCSTTVFAVCVEAVALLCALTENINKL